MNEWQYLLLIINYAKIRYYKLKLIIIILNYVLKLCIKRGCKRPGTDCADLWFVSFSWTESVINCSSSSFFSHFISFHSFQGSFVLLATFLSRIPDPIHPVIPSVILLDWFSLCIVTSLDRHSVDLTFESITRTRTLASFNRTWSRCLCLETDRRAHWRWSSHFRMPYWCWKREETWPKIGNLRRLRRRCLDTSF